MIIIKCRQCGEEIEASDERDDLCLWCWHDGEKNESLDC